MRGTNPDVSTTASHFRPSRLLRSPSRSPWSFSMSGKRPGFVLPRLKRVRTWPRARAASTIWGPRNDGAAQDQDLHRLRPSATAEARRPARRRLPPMAAVLTNSLAVVGPSQVSSPCERRVAARREQRDPDPPGADDEHSRGDGDCGRGDRAHRVVRPDRCARPRRGRRRCR